MRLCCSAVFHEVLLNSTRQCTGSLTSTCPDRHLIVEIDGGYQRIGVLGIALHYKSAHHACAHVLLETLVDTPRFRGTCYRAANWIHVGQTAGRGRMDSEHKAHGQAVKDIYVYPLVPDARQRLCGDLAR